MQNNRLKSFLKKAVASLKIFSIMRPRCHGETHHLALQA